MTNANRLFFAVFCVAGGLIGTFALLLDQSDGPDATRQTSQREFDIEANDTSISLPELVGTIAPNDLGRGAVERQDELAPAKGVSHEAVQQSRPRLAHRDPIPDEVFEAKYAALEPEKYLETAKMIKDQMGSIKEELFDSLYELGEYESYPYEYDDEGRVLPPGKNLTNYTAPTVTYFKLYDAPEAQERRRVFLEQTEFPHVYDLDDEWRWLALRDAEHKKAISKK